MNLYLISQSVNNGYDTYGSAVVAAKTASAARFIHPYPGVKEWDGKEDVFGTWCRMKDVQVKYLGKAAKGISGIVCVSFRAG